MCATCSICSHDGRFVYNGRGAKDWPGSQRLAGVRDIREPQSCRLLSTTAKTIFKLAIRVAVCFDPDGNGSDLAMGPDKGSGRRCDRRKCKWQWRGSSHRRSSRSCRPFLIPLSQLLPRPWVDRFWVRQDILLGIDQAMVLVGRRWRFCVSGSGGNSVAEHDTTRG